MKKEINVWAIAFIACWQWAPTSVIAQQDSLRATSLREVVVTATKFPKNILETAKVMNVIDEEQIQRASGKDLSQLLNEQVGLVINGANSNPGKDKSVFLRGASGSYTLILLDGIPVTDPSGVGGAFDLRMLPLEQVERIEILKGSQSTLYGTDAIAGVINIITKSKGNNPHVVNGALSYGSFNTLRFNAGLSGTSDKLDYMVQYSRVQTDGISEARDTTGTAGFDTDGFNQEALQLQVAAKPVKGLSLRPFFRLNNFDGKYDAGAFADDPAANYTATMLNYGFLSSYDYNKGSVQLMLSDNHSDRTFSSGFGEFLFNGKFSHAELFSTYRFTESVSVLGGITYQYFSLKDENNPEFSMVSPYVSLFINRSYGFSGEAGFRYVSHQVYGNNFTFSLNPAYFLIRDKLRIFANYSTGFKTPTLSQLFGPYGANPDLQPEVSRTGDAGVHLIFPDKKFDVRVTYFKRYIKDAITFSGSYLYENLNTLDDRGVEVESSLRLNRLTLTGYYAHVTGEVTDITGTRENDLLRRPRHQFGMNAGYRLAKSVYVSLNVKNFGRRNDAYFDPNTFTTVPVQLDAFRLLDVYAEKRFNEKVTLFAEARNLLNQDYYEVYGYAVQRLNVTVGISVRY